MRFDKHLPTEPLTPYIKYFVVSENPEENEYKVFPSPGLVIGFQYKGGLSLIKQGKIERLNTTGITGITDRYRTFRNSAGIGTILVYFTETGFIHFSSHWANELFNLSLSLDNIFGKGSVNEVEEKLAFAATDKQRIKVVEHFLLSQLKDRRTDRLIAEAVELICLSKGTIRIRELNKKLSVSQSPLEKRFRKIVGTTPKQFALIIRFNSVLEKLDKAKSLTQLCYENNFFDQAHFIKDFQQFTGDTPAHFKRFL